MSNHAELAAEVQRMSTHPGITGCALVDADTGLVWYASGGDQADQVWEAAVDYWRLHDRQKVHFAGLGDLSAAVMYHTGGVLAILPCGDEPPLLMVARGDHRGVDWITWQRKVKALALTLAGR